MKQGESSLSIWAARGVAVLMATWIAWRTFDLFQAAWPFNTDDAYITLRYARNLAEGHGVMWNPGDFPVEGYSNFLFVILGALSLKVGVEPILVLKYSSCAALLGTCVLMYRLMRRWSGPVGATLPALFLTSYIGTVMWTVSGLETGVYQFLLIGSLTAFIAACERLGLGVRSDDAEPGDPTTGNPRIAHALLAISGLLAFLGALTRPEGPVVAIVTVGALGAITAGRFWQAHRAGDEEKSAKSARFRVAFKAWLILAACFALPYLVYFAWRYQYFWRLFPNTVYCKADYTGDPWKLIRAFWDHAFVLILLSVFFPWRKADVRFCVLACVPVLYALILYGVDPIIAHNNRHFLAAYACVAVTGFATFAMMAESAWSKLPRHLTELVVVAALAWWIGAADATKKSASKWANSYAARMDVRQKLGEWLEDRLEPDDWMVIGDAGIAPYQVHAKVADAFCLNSWRYTNDDIGGDTKLYVNWVLLQEPEVIVVHSHSAKRLKPRGEYGFYPDLVKRDEFKSEYKLLKKFGAPGDSFHYWVYAHESTELAATK